MDSSTKGFLVAIAFIAVGCGGGVAAADASEGGVDAQALDVADGAASDSVDTPSVVDVVQPHDVTDVAPDSPACVATSTSDLAGVHIVIDASHCVFTLAQASAGVTIPYDVVIDADVTGVVAQPQDAGQCGMPDTSGLIPLEVLSATGQSYCRCDIGFCAPTPGTPVTLRAGQYHHAFTWDGTNWNGPSDTGNPHGAPFPVGTYALRVSAVGTHTTGGSTTHFTVAGTLSITLIP
jgi:hypothetical protein